MLDYLDMDMKHKVIKSVTLPPLDDSYSLKTYKVCQIHIITNFQRR
jgi:hypothetical protein